MVMLHIISKSKVQLPTVDHPPPDSTIQLSLFDAQFVKFPIVKTVLLYPNAIALPSSFNSFKSSLALILRHFHPFVGDLTNLPSSDDVAIICSKDSGVILVEAISDLDICDFVKGSTLDIESIYVLAPNNNTSELPLPVLSAQFTSFTGGGIAIGIASHHAAMDGWGLWQFIRSWAITCHDGAVPHGLSSVHDRSIISYPHKEEIKKQILLKLHAPNLPKLPPLAETNPKSDNSIKDHDDRSIGKLLTVDLSFVQKLKQRAIHETTGRVSSPPTTFQVLAAQFWIAVARAKGLKIEDVTPTVLIIPMDCRALLNPPVDASYTGNCVCSIFVMSNGTNLMASDGLSKTCESIGKAISIAKEQSLRGTNMNNPVCDIGSFHGLKVIFSGSHRLQVYDADFGWGIPSFHVLAPSDLNAIGMMDFGMLTTGMKEVTIDLQVGSKGGMEEISGAFLGGVDI